MQQDPAEVKKMLSQQIAKNDQYNIKYMVQFGVTENIKLFISTYKIANDAFSISPPVLLEYLGYLEGLFHPSPAHFPTSLGSAGQDSPQR